MRSCRVINEISQQTDYVSSSSLRLSQSVCAVVSYDELSTLLGVVKSSRSSSAAQ